jgi:hypothetical protein
MRVALASLLASVLIVIGQQPAAQVARDRPDTSPAGTGVIAGRVVVLGTQPAVPVRRARVTLLGDRLPEATLTDTDTDGRYRFEQLPAGSYRVKAEKPGYVTLEHGATRPFSRPAPIELKDGQSLTADLALPRGAALEGTILDETGETVQNITVAAVRFTFTGGRQLQPLQEARTDDLGRYRIHSLPPGTYYVQAFPDPLETAARGPGPLAPGERPRGLARTYFPGTPRLTDARRITLETGQDVSMLDFAVGTVPLATVTGHILDATGRTTMQASSRVQRVDGPVGEVRGFSDPRTPSRFEYRTVPPGDYWIMAAAVPAAGGVTEFAAMRVTIAGEDLPALTLRTERGMAIDGRVEVDGADRLPSLAGLHVIAHEQEYQLPSPGRGAPAPGSDIAVREDGRFTIGSLFGPRLIRLARLPAGFALQRVWLAETDITDTVTDFRATNAPRPMRIILTSRTATLSGEVTDDRGGTPAEARIVIFAEDERLWGLHSRFVRSVTADASGRFAIDGLLPGRYLVSAVPYLEDDAWTDVDVLRQLRAHAVPLTLGARQEETITLRAR